MGPAVEALFIVVVSLAFTGVIFVWVRFCADFFNHLFWSLAAAMSLPMAIAYFVIFLALLGETQ